LLYQLLTLLKLESIDIELGIWQVIPHHLNPPEKNHLYLTLSRSTIFFRWRSLPTSELSTKMGQSIWFQCGSCEL